MIRILIIIQVYWLAFNLYAQVGEPDFRNIFASNVAKNYPAADLPRLVLKIPKLLLEPIESTDKENFVEIFESRHGQYRADDLYRLSQKTPFRKVNDELIKNSVKNKKIIYFFIPGIVGELLTDKAVLTELLNNKKTSFHKSTQQYLEQYKKLNGKALQDPVFKMRSNSMKDEDLDKLLIASSIDDHDQVPLVKLVYLFPEFLSLETFIPCAKRAEIAIRRIEKFINLIEMSEKTQYDFVIIGYSQGSAVAMEIASQLKKYQSPLLEKLKAVVSYCGTVWGSDLADVLFLDHESTSTPLMGRQFKAFRQLINNLETEVKNPLDFFRGYYRNKKNILGFIHEYLSDTEEGIKTAKAKASVVYLMKMVMRMALVEFKALDFGLFHYENMKKLKKFGEAVIAGASELTTESMENWHRTHILPHENIHYYNLSGVSGDINVDKEYLKDSLAGMDLESVDYEMLLNQFNIIYNQTGVALNDSQVTIQRTRFWPELSVLVNPSQPIYQTTFLGALGTHHWGVTFDYFNASTPKMINSFKRPELILSLAQAISLDLDKIGIEMIYK